MNLLTAIVGVGIGAAGITSLTGFVDLQSTTPILALMLGLAVGIDYALFIVTRFRQELLRGRDVGDAIATAVGTAGSAVLTAGITVVIALAGLVVAGILSGLLGTGPGAPLLSLTPILVIGVLFGLAMDYQVFLVSRIHEAHSKGTAPRPAIVTGFRQAAPVVVAAAAIMFAVFAGFVPSGGATIKSIAFALAIGIAFDAVVVRLVIMPSALALLGERAWWLPRRLRWLPRLDVEGLALEEETPRTPAPAGR